MYIGFGHMLLIVNMFIIAFQATSGLGAAAAYDLSKEGFYVVLGTVSINCFARKYN